MSAKHKTYNTINVDEGLSALASTRCKHALSGMSLPCVGWFDDCDDVLNHNFPQ